MATQGQVIPPHDSEDEILSEGTLSVHEEADRSHQVATAKKYPRSITKFRNDLTELVMASQAVAMEMMYSLPRAGKQLVGPSVRFAEAAVSCWGNARVGVEVVDVDRREGVVVAEGRFYDCERNVGFAIRTRRRNVMTKKDDDSYQVTGSAASSIALRNAILRGVPKALWNDIFEKAKQTAAGDVMSMEKIRTELLKLFTALGVTEARVFAALDIKGSADIGAEEIIALKAWHKQLVAKESTIEELFGHPDDVEILWLMEAMGWPLAKRTMSNKNFEKDKSGQLAHLREEASKAGIVYSSKAGAQQSKQQGPQEVKQASADPTTADKTSAAEDAKDTSGSQGESATSTQAQPQANSARTAATSNAQPISKSNW